MEANLYYDYNNKLELWLLDKLPDTAIQQMEGSLIFIRISSLCYRF
jgi:hypothetical protein